MTCSFEIYYDNNSDLIFSIKPKTISKKNHLIRVSPINDSAYYINFGDNQSTNFIVFLESRNRCHSKWARTNRVLPAIGSHALRSYRTSYCVGYSSQEVTTTILETCYWNKDDVYLKTKNAAYIIRNDFEWLRAVLNAYVFIIIPWKKSFYAS